MSFILVAIAISIGMSISQRSLMPKRKSAPEREEDMRYLEHHLRKGGTLVEWITEKLPYADISMEFLPATPGAVVYLSEGNLRDKVMLVDTTR